MKIFRTILGLVVSIEIYLIISILIYNIQHWLNLFAVPIFFFRIYFSVIIAIHIGFLIVKGSFEAKSKTFLIVYSLIAISILYDVLFTYNAPGKLHGIIYFCGFILGTLMVTKPDLLIYFSSFFPFLIPLFFHLYSIILIFEKFNTIWGIICIFIPPYPEIILFITYWKGYGFVNSYSKIVLDFWLFYLIGMLSISYLVFWNDKNKLDIDI